MKRNVVIVALVFLVFTNISKANRRKSWSNRANEVWESVKNIGHPQAYGLGKAPKTDEFKNPRHQHKDTYWETIMLDEKGIPVINSYNNTSHKVKYEAAIHLDRGEKGKIKYTGNNNKRNEPKELKKKDVPQAVQQTAEWYLQELQYAKKNSDDLAEVLARKAHQSRYEGARNTLISTAVIVGTGAAIAYLGKAAYNRWFRKEANHIKNLFGNASKTFTEIAKNADRGMSKSQDYGERIALSNDREMALILNRIITDYNNGKITEKERQALEAVLAK